MLSKPNFFTWNQKCTAETVPPICLRKQRTCHLPWENQVSKFGVHMLQHTAVLNHYRKNLIQSIVRRPRKERAPRKFGKGNWRAVPRATLLANKPALSPAAILLMQLLTKWVLSEEWAVGGSKSARRTCTSGLGLERSPAARSKWSSCKYFADFVTLPHLC